MKPKSKWIKPSTQAFFREADQLPDYSRFDRLHAYIYGRWIYFYIGLGRNNHPLVRALTPLFKGFGKLLPQKPLPENGSGTLADGYHGKVISAETARQMVTIDQEIRIDDLEQVIPYPRARAIILQNPAHIVALDCPCRMAQENPCLPMDVCLVVGEPFASFVSEHHPNHTRWISQQEAVEIIQAEHQRGHVSHAFFKDAMLGRFYAICNCCECCCGAMNAHRNGTPMLASSGYVCVVAEDLCAGCGTCEEVCQFSAISAAEGYAVVDYAACMGCGVCLEHCEMEALALERDENKGIPLEIQRLMEEAAQ